MPEILEPDISPVSELTAAQRRVLGVLVEKAYTTPEYYPLTLKAATTACNQKSNRHPLMEYSEDDVADVLDQLRELGLAAVIHTESGRTERFRHYMRKAFSFTEPQLAILTELMLRGRQSQGELRTRASRMVPIETLDQLRHELTGLMSMKLAVADGPLDRRGVEVDHNFYAASERSRMKPNTRPAPADGEDHGRIERNEVVGTRTVPTTMSAAHSAREPARDRAVADGTATNRTSLEQRVADLEAALETLTAENLDLRSSLKDLRDAGQQLTDQFDKLRRDLGG